MSKNKIIKELHETTLIPFKDCRATLKRNKWNFRAAYIKLYGGLDGNFISSLDAEKRAEIMNALNSAVNSITNAFKELQAATESAVKSASKFTAAVLAAYKENGGKI